MTIFPCPDHLIPVVKNFGPTYGRTNVENVGFELALEETDYLSDGMGSGAALIRDLSDEERFVLSVADAIDMAYMQRPFRDDGSFVPELVGSDYWQNVQALLVQWDDAGFVAVTVFEDKGNAESQFAALADVYRNEDEDSE